jgi:hypothetical protein
MKKPSAATAAASGPADPGRLFAEAPTLVEYLTIGTWEDGEPRELSTLNIFRQDGHWKLWLNDRACSRFTCVSGATVEDAVHSLEEALAADEVEWRVPKDKQPRRK